MTGARPFAIAPSVEYALLERALTEGPLRVDGGSGTADAGRPLIQELCDRGLLCELYRDRRRSDSVAIYAITDWGRVAWSQEKRRIERARLRTAGQAEAPGFGGARTGTR